MAELPESVSRAIAAVFAVPIDDPRRPELVAALAAAILTAAQEASAAMIAHELSGLRTEVHSNYEAIAALAQERRAAGDDIWKAVRHVQSSVDALVNAILPEHERR